MKKVLITGAGGFTGRYLAAELAAAGYEVIGMFQSPPRELPPGVAGAVACDLMDEAALARAVREIRPGIVAHLAAIAFVAHGNVDEVYRTNLLGTRHLLEALASLEVPPRMTLLPSSANIYGNANVETLTEETPPAPANDYAVSKLAMEYLARLYAQRVPSVVVRPFNYTGVGQDEAFLIPKIVSHIRRRATAIELGNIDVARDFTDVRTVVKYYRQLLECPEACGRTLNVCSGRVHTLREVLEMAQEISGYRLEVRVNPAFVRASEVKVLKGSRERLVALVGATADIPLRETVRWMLEEPA